MNKRHLHHVWTRLRLIKPWYFLLIAVVSTVICVFALRANNEHMIKLRSAVYTADQNDADVQTALNQLQAYVTAHMNTNLSAGPNAVYPPIQLKNTYDRLVEKARSTASSQTNNQIYTDAQHYCEQQNSTDFSGHNRVPCIEQYVQSHGGTTVPTMTTIPDALYKFSFISPKWSPDLAGWTLVAVSLSWLLFITTLVANKWFRTHVA